jgi:hypothetical protein
MLNVQLMKKIHFLPNMLLQVVTILKFSTELQFRGLILLTAHQRKRMARKKSSFQKKTYSMAISPEEKEKLRPTLDL